MAQQSPSYLDGLPPEVADRIAMQRIVGAAEAAAFCGFSLAHWRRLYRSGKVPTPVKLGARKLGWRQQALNDFTAQRSA